MSSEHDDFDGDGDNYSGDRRRVALHVLEEDSDRRWRKRGERDECNESDCRTTSTSTASAIERSPSSQSSPSHSDLNEHG